MNQQESELLEQAAGLLTAIQKVWEVYQCDCMASMLPKLRIDEAERIEQVLGQWIDRYRALSEENSKMDEPVP